MKQIGGHFLYFLLFWNVRAGVLCLLLSVVTAACPDANNVDIPCPFNEFKEVSCTYRKGLGNFTTSVYYPGKVKDLDAKTVVMNENGNCKTYLNITWKVNEFANPFKLRGFLLNVTFDWNGPRNILRTYNLSISDWDQLKIDGTFYSSAFRHECIEPAGGTSYLITLHSLPSDPSENPENYNFVSLKTSENFAPCDIQTYTDLNVTYDWRATMWVKEDPSESTLEICFYLAPDEFGFTAYRVAVVYDNTSSIFVEQRAYYSNATKDRQICVKFTNICPAVYKAWVMPLNEPDCVCRAGPNRPDDCRDTCYATYISSIDMTSSVCTSPTTTPRTTVTSLPHMNPLVSSDSATSPKLLSSADSDGLMAPEAEKLDNGKIAGIVVGVIVVVALIALIAVCLYLRYCHDDEGNYIKPDFPEEGSEVAITSKISVLLIYSSDNESHRAVVRTFAAFLHANCGCDVRYDEWCHVEIAETNPIEWLSKQFYIVKHVIIINSLGGFMQHQGWIERNEYVPTSSLLLPDVFIPALRQIYAKQLMDSHQFRCYHVCFPYTEKKHVLEMSFGRCYRLMDHIEDLFLNIHGMTKFSHRGTTMANEIKAGTYFLNSKEGQALYEALQEATDYIVKYPNWFRDCYRREGEDTDPVVASGVSSFYILDNVSNQSSSTDSHSRTEDDVRTSDLGIETDYIPPSFDGSFSEHESISPCSDDRMFKTSLQPTGGIEIIPPEDFDDTSSIGTRSFVIQATEMNEKFDSGIETSLVELRNGSQSFLYNYENMC